MANTKDKILKTSVRLFNENGLTNVSLRSIADDMKISVGNLQYHFKKREEIINALYFQMVEDIDAVVKRQEYIESSLKMFFSISKVITETLFEYRFFLLDFTTIMRENGIIKKHYQQLLIQREQEFFSFITLLTDANIMREEVLPREYKNLFLRFQTLSDFWFSSMTIKSKKITKKIIPEYLEVLNQTLYPYLTEKGKSDYLKIVKA